MIALSCPQCAAQLEVDDGFRGGVCRCYECGTLMTVPDDPGQEQAEPLFKKSSSSSGSGRTRGSSPAAPPPPRQNAPSARSPVPQPQPVASAAAAAPDESEYFETASGKKVRISAEQLDHIPIASKRKVVRWTTRISLVLIMAGLASVVLYGAMKVFTAPPGEKPSVTAEEARKDIFKIENNFFLDRSPQVLGVTAGPSNALIIDGSLSMQRYLEWIKIASGQSLQTLQDRTIQIALAQEAGTVFVPDAPASAASLDAAGFLSKLERLRATGRVTLGASLQQVLGHAPEHLVVVASQLPEEQAKLLVEKSLGVKLFVLLIDNMDITDESELTLFAKGSGGDVIHLPGVTIEQWYEQYLDAQATQN